MRIRIAGAMQIGAATHRLLQRADASTGACARAAGGHVPVAGIDRLAQGAPVYAQLAARVEQQDEGATTNHSAFAQLRPLQAAEQAILLVDPGDPLQVGGGPVRRLARGDIHQPWLSRVRRSMIAALAREM